MLNDSKKRFQAGYLICCAVVFILIYVLNAQAVYSSDDYMYHFFWESGMPGETVRPIESFPDLLRSLWNHYCGFNGRIVSHFFVMLFMKYDKWVFNLCNSAMYLFVGALLLMHIEYRISRWKVRDLAAVYLGMWMFFPHFGLSVLWLSGACNYLWMSALGLIFLLPYRKFADENHVETDTWILRLIMIPIGLLAGCTNENSGGAAILLAVLFIACGIYQKKKIPVFGVTGIVSACMGLGILLAAPSSMGRMEADAFALRDYLKRLREIVGFSYHYVLPLLILLLILIWILRKEYKKEEWKRYLLVPGCYCAAGAASVLVLILSPVISGKSWIFADCYLIISAGILAMALRNAGYRIRRWQRAGIGLFLAGAVVWYGAVWSNLHRTYLETRQQIHLIEEAKEEGQMNVTVPMLTRVENTYNAVYHEPQLCEDKEDWFNQWMARYYKVESITGIPR